MVVGMVRSDWLLTGVFTFCSFTYFFRLLAMWDVNCHHSSQVWSCVIDRSIPGVVMFHCHHMCGIAFGVDLQASWKLCIIYYLQVSYTVPANQICDLRSNLSHNVNLESRWDLEASRTCSTPARFGCSLLNMVYSYYLTLHCNNSIIIYVVDNIQWHSSTQSVLPLAGHS